MNMGSFYEADEELEQFYNSHRREGLTDLFSFRRVSEEEVIRAMNGIKSKAEGIDGIGIDIIKAVSPYASGAITHLINESLILALLVKNYETKDIEMLFSSIVFMSNNYKDKISTLSNKEYFFSILSLLTRVYYIYK